MKVLVTGAAGFIGQHVCSLLREQRHEVIGSDVYVDSDLLWDITKACPPFGSLDAVIHLAALANPRECDADPAKAFNVNVNGTHQVLELARKSGAKKFVFSSSAHVYDIPSRYLPADELLPLRLNNTYTTTKILGEQLCELYWTNHGLSYTILRLFNAYGLNQAKGYYIPDQVSKAKEGCINLKGGNTTKDWVWVGDVADAFVRALSTGFVGAVNIGTGVETNLETIARIIARCYQVELKAIPSDNATRMCADWRRAKSILGWHPTVSLEEGLDRTINSYKAVPV